MNVPGDAPVLELRATGAHGGRSLLVVFSARKASRFHFYRATLGMKDDILFVRDPYQTAWYQRGLGPGETLDTLEALLRQMAEPYRSVRTVGSSMGGYAALYFGARLEARQALALVPQIVVDARLGRGPSGGHKVQCPDIGPLLRASTGTEFLIALGGLDLIDLAHAARLCGDDGLPNHIRIGTYERQDHMLPAFLARTGLLGNFFHDSFTRGRPAPSEGAGYREGLPLDRARRMVALRCLTLLRRRAVQEAYELLRQSRPDCPEWPARDHLLVELAPAAGIPDREVAILSDSLARRFPASLHCRYQAARVAAGLGDGARAHAHLAEILAVRPAHPGARALRDRLRKADALPA